VGASRGSGACQSSVFNVSQAQPCAASCAASRTHLVYGDDLAVRLLDLAELAEEVPEPRLSDDLVGRKYAHTVDLRGGVGL
jgi:hypothetical protein